MFEIRQRRHKLVFHGIDERPVLSLNRGFSTPVEINYRHSDKELIFLAANDSDPYCRWQAFRTIACKQIMSAMRAIQKRRKPRWNSSFLDSALKIAGDDTLEPAFRALTLSLPEESELARMIGRNIDPDAIHTARNSLQSAIGEIIEPVRRAIVSTLAMDADYSPSAQAAGKRSLSNLLLAYGIYADSEVAEKELLEHFRKSDNMTDLEFSFRLILQQLGGTDHFEDALTSFYERFKDDHIVLDKWFMLQATIPGKQAVKTARMLTEHEAFKWTNPNRVRSVIGSFAVGNPTGFNRKDGTGYRFVTAAIARLDGINPQVAARMLTAFRSWKQLESQRRGHAEKALRELKTNSKLSRDVSEILDRTLA
jgi:aminopeptidase N